MPHGMQPEERLALYSESYIDKDHCQLWLGSKTKGGYGKLWWKGRLTSVHRIVWEIERGPIPLGLHVLHRCDVRACRNIDHLFLGTPADNVADKIAKGRQVRGEDASWAKLTEAEVHEIRRLPRGIRYREIGAAYGISPSAVCFIRQRRNWAHL